MGVISKTTEEINTLLDKVEGMPDEGVSGKTPVLETGSTITLDPGQNATSEVVANGTDESGNPKYKINFGIPRGADGSGGSGGGTADSVEWKNVLNKPTWVNSFTKPSYTAAEVGALPSTTTIPSKTSELNNDSGFVKNAELKTVNGNSLIGSGDIEISGIGSGIADAPSDGKTYGRKNGEWSVITSAGGGSIDISEIFNRIGQIAEIGGTCTDEDYNTLKEYAENGVVTYADVGGTVLKIDLMTASGSISIGYSMLSGDIYINVAAYISEDKHVSLQSGMFFPYNKTGEAAIGESYSKPSSYSEINPSDTIATAIGKLEAGIGTEGSSDDEFYLPIEVYNLNALATKEEITAAFGGDDGVQALKDAMNEKKKIYIIIDKSFLKAVIPVSYDIALGVTWGISFKKYMYSSSINSASTIRITPSRVYSIFDGGYGLSASFYGLTNSSTTEEISTAVGGENGMKKLIQAIIDGNRLYIETSEEFQQKTDLLCNLYSIDNNGDMSVLLWGFGYFIWGQMAGAINIQYEKSSNTFSASVTNLLSN